MTGKKVLLVDDEPEICELINLYLSREGFEVSTAKNSQEALKLAREKEPDLIILDILLPGIDGIEICMELRKITEVPIIFLSCKGESEDKIMGLTVGGDDYITKPFSPGEMVARVKAHLRRSRLMQEKDKEQTSRLVFPNLVIDLLSHEVLLGGKKIDLSSMEFKILAVLAQNPNKVFSAEELYEKAWGSNSMGDFRTLMVHISNLRKKIEPDPSQPRYITTIRGVGYKFMAEE